MADQELNIPTPSIAKSSSFTMTGQGFNNVGPTGGASFQLPLPVSGGRGADPQLAMTYNSQSGNGPLGLGWSMGHGQISRRTNKGTPRYDDDDEIVGHDQQICTRERNVDGSLKSRIETTFNGKEIGRHTVVRYTPEVESDFSLRERWEGMDPTDSTKKLPTFWLISGPNGSLHLYGKTADSRVADPQDPLRVATWLLCETMTAHGEHIYYEYKPDEADADDFRDYRSQRYLRRVLYGNFKASQDLYSWSMEDPGELDWHFHLLFDYGERSTSLSVKPEYDVPNTQPCPVRPDASSAFGHGFEIATRRRCAQVLMFHYFPTELGPDPVLVRRLLLKYNEHIADWSYSQLTSAYYQAWGPGGDDDVELSPPVQFEYAPLELNQTPTRLFAEENMPGIGDGRHYQCVDLYGEGVSGFLCRYDQAWFYREPVRGKSGPDHIAYGPWTVLDKIPVINSKKPVMQILTSLSGSGRFDWLTAQPGFAGIRSMNPDRSWSEFKTFSKTPTELFGAFAQFGDLANEGLMSVALIGPRSVRFYRSNVEEGFQQAEEVLRDPDDDRLPLFSNARSEVVMFGNLLASDTTELCRIRHDEIKCWPNLGFGKFGKGRVLSGPVFEYSTFDAARIRIADLDGSGAPALIYLNDRTFDIYLNQGGNRLATDPIRIRWPEDVQYERTCEVTFADLQGLGCASLILTVPHMKPRHWRYDFVAAKPYLMRSSNNNMGCSASIVYRSSAQEWLDEKQQWLAANPEGVPVCHMPLNVQVVKQQFQLDEITGNRLSQSFNYREGYYDPWAREYRGFGYLEQTDSERQTATEDTGFTAPIRACSWYIIGQFMNRPRTGYFAGDDEAVPLGATVITRYDALQERDIPLTPAPDSVLPYEIARGMSGTLMRTEIYNAEDPPLTAKPYTIEEYRYLVREVRPKGAHYPDAIILPLSLEKISYQYEQFIDDPLCRHELGLRWNTYGALTHSLVVSYARRRTVTDAPPFEDVDEQRWWCDAHDEAQQSYYINESRSRFIDLDTDTQRRLGLAWQMRGNALRLPKGNLPNGLNPGEVSFEQLTLHQDSTQWNALRTLTQQSEQRYLKTSDQSVLDSGEAEYEALSGPLELAQMDETALAAYDVVPPPFDIRVALKELGYKSMKFFFETSPPSEADNLWSTTYNFAKYADVGGFFKVREYNETPCHGVTKIQYDDFQLKVRSVELPDGCTTSVTHDYHTSLPSSILDANENTEEVIYDAAGQPLALSFYGTENGVAAGFRALSDFERPENLLPGPAISNPQAAIQCAATTLRKDYFSWMGLLPADISPELLAIWVASGDVLPSGHICASARQRLERRGALNAADQALSEVIANVERVPVHSVILTADRYPDDPVPAQIQISKACFDGFGRELQTQQLVDPGMAYAVDVDGTLIVDGDELREVFADSRWRISARVEYNNKGLPVRKFRPFFADTYRYVNDASLREHGYFDQLFYDVLGREVQLTNAMGHFSRETYHPWYQISEDFNDTAEEQP
ncbi:toxin [Pseudomonas fluorescens]|uniref:Toxin n=1 Tax=Pseudomonas fluorescens TaxID=294 RepID=A0A448E0G4_PSEFL|nr:SpvB/TcaC N-terminal domain-containing protein [Pseudomonas fluorescens]VEF12574.1 toxin [Pseudomonas fluorescens]